MRINRKNEIDFRYGPLTGIKSDGSKVVILSEDMLGDEFFIEPASGNKPAKLKIDVQKLVGGGTKPEPEVPGPGPVDPTNPTSPSLVLSLAAASSPLQALNDEIFILMDAAMSGFNLGAQVRVKNAEGAYELSPTGVYHVVDTQMNIFPYIEVVVGNYMNMYSVIQNIIYVDSPDEYMRVELTQLNPDNSFSQIVANTDKAGVEKVVENGDVLFTDFSGTKVADGVYNLKLVDEVTYSVQTTAVQVTNGVVSFG